MHEEMLDNCMVHKCRGGNTHVVKVLLEDGESLSLLAVILQDMMSDVRTSRTRQPPSLQNVRTPHSEAGPDQPL